MDLTGSSENYHGEATIVVFDFYHFRLGRPINESALKQLKRGGSMDTGDAGLFVVQQVMGDLLKHNSTCGYVICYTRDKWIPIGAIKYHEEGSEVIIDRLGVIKRFERQGIGRALMNIVMIYGRQRKLKRLTWVDGGTIECGQFYDKIAAIKEGENYHLDI